MGEDSAAAGEACEHRWIRTDSGTEHRESDGRTRSYIVVQCPKCGETQRVTTDWE